MDRTVKVIPAEMNFSYCLSKYDCYRKRTGKCSLLLSEEGYQKELLREGHDKWYYDDGSVRKCVELKDSLLQYGNTSEIRICRFACGHWGITDGQHRLCIYKTANLGELEVTRTGDWDVECRVCYFKKKVSNLE